MRKHERELIDFLRTEYNAEQLYLEPRGKHKKLKFRCHGSEYSYLVGGPSDYRAIKNIRSELKRMLGPATPPPEQPEEEPPMNKTYIPPAVARTYTKFNPSPPDAPETLVPAEATPAPGKTWDIKVSAYQNNKLRNEVQIWFIFRAKDAAEIRQSYTDHFHVEKLDEEHWKLSPGGTHSLIKYDNRFRISHTDQEIKSFGVSPAEAVEVNGEILIYLAKENRKPVGTYRYNRPPQPQPQQPVQSSPAPVPPGVQPIKVMIQQPMLMTSSSVMEERMLDITRQIYDIESLCPYRIVRLPDGRLVWRAPEIG